MLEISISLWFSDRGALMCWKSGVVGIFNPYIVFKGILDVFHARMVLRDRCGSVMLTRMTRHPLGSMDSAQTILEWVERNFVHLLL